MKSKTLILSPQTNDNSTQTKRGILTIYEENGLLMCKIRLYNVNRLNRDCKIGVYHINQVYSANLLEKNGTYTSSIVGDFDMDKDFYAAIINPQNNNEVILAGGTYSGHFFNNTDVFEKEFPTKSENSNITIKDHNDIEINIDEISESCSKDCANCIYKKYFYANNKNNTIDNNLTFENDQNTTYDYSGSNSNADPFLNPSFIKTNNENFNADNSANLRAQNQNSYSSLGEKDLPERLRLKSRSSLFDESNQNVNSFAPSSLPQDDCGVNPVESSESANLRAQNQNPYSPLGEKDLPERFSGASSESANLRASLMSQFTYVFENYPPDETLNSLIDNGKFVKINEPNSNSQYSIGAVFEEENMKYICYAVLSEYNTKAPQELGEHFQWLPLDKSDPLSDGYFIVFQDAEDLKIVEF